MLVWQAVVLGLVEGVTEYLPVSSTGHLIIASALMGLDTPGQKASVDDFSIIIQGGAILAVLGLYRVRVAQMIRGVMGWDAAGRRLFINLFIAFVPAAVLGLLLNKKIEESLFRPWPVLAALALGGVWMIWLDRGRGGKGSGAGARPAALTIDTMGWKQALAIGCFQVVAMWPGTSRSMMTIGGGNLLGLKPREAAEFSFLLGLPTLGGACVYKLGKNLRHAHETGEANLFAALGVWSVVIGIVVAGLSAALAVRWLVSFLNRHGLAPFGWYRLALCVALGGLMVSGSLTIGGEDLGRSEVSVPVTHP